MYKVLLAIESLDLLNEITALHVWGEPTEFAIAAVKDNEVSVYEELKNNSYDLLIAESTLLGEKGLRLFKRIKAEGLCVRIAFCGRDGNFSLAREGIVLGIYEYFVKPFESDRFISLFRRIKNETNGKKAAEIYYIEELSDLFENHDPSISEYLIKLMKLEDYGHILNGTVEEIFNKYEWLDLFLCKEDFLTGKGDTDAQMIMNLFEEFCALYPPHNAKIHDVIQYILFNPESDLRQKALSEELYINSSYLSTMFAAQADMRFVDYVTHVKLRRAAWLLKNTNMKIFEIADRLDYKDIGYFSRQFKKIYGITPSEYRIPDNYEFEI